MKRPLLFLATFIALLSLPGTSRAQLQPPLWPFGPKGLVLTPPKLVDEQPLEDIYVLPARAGQNRVPYWQFDWQTYEFCGNKGGSGVRLYYYGREGEAATYAVSAIRRAYDELVTTFDYLPRTTIPFILYASYSEFQATNVFSIGEGTLGATDPADLRMAMPFFGSINQFSRVFTHEMAHQFTIQKVRDAAADSGLESPLMLMPLWFIEGLAEYGSFGGMDPEGDYILRDLLTDPDPRMGYALPDFFDARAGGYIGIYKLGQARVTFISEEYGHAKLIELLERSTLLAGTAPGAPAAKTKEKPKEQPREASSDPDAGSGGAPKEASADPDAGSGASPAKVSEAPKDAADGGTSKPSGPPEKPGPKSFADYVSLVLGEPPAQINGRYHDWLKRRYFSQYLETGQTLSDFELFEGLVGEPDSMSVSDDGKLIVYRTVQRETGVSQLFLQDVRDPKSRVLVAADQKPGLESLHPVDRRVTSLRGKTLLYSGRVGDRDVLFLRRIEIEEKGEGDKPRVSIELSKTERFEAGELLEIYDPALSPDGSEVAFVGIDLAGFRDLYVMELEGPFAGSMRRLTDDIWCEADLYWDEERLLFTSDETESHEPNVFALALATGGRQRLTWHTRADRNPMPALGGVVFTSYEKGKPDLWLLQGETERRLTDTPSAALHAVPLAEDELLTLTFHRGSYQLYKVPEKQFAAEVPVVRTGIGGSGLSTAQDLRYPRAQIPDGSKPYQPRSPGNWRVEASAGAVVGPTSVGAAGLAVTDLLRDHVMLVNIAVYGSLKLTDALVFYLNQARRPELGVGVFHTFETRRDKSFPDDPNYYLQRMFGVAGLARYPLDRFRRFETSLEIRGIERFAYTDYGGNLYSDWQRLNGGVEPEVVASAQLGFDTTILNVLAGPIEGSSVVAAVSTGYLPVRDFAYARFQGDAQKRFHLLGRSSFLMRAAGGMTTGGTYSPQFFLSSIGNMEGFRFGDERLLGDNYYVSNLRLTFPLDPLVYIPIFSGIYGVAGFDYGATFDRWNEAWERRSLSAVLGTDVGLGALVVQLHFGRLIDVGGTVPAHDWVFNLDLRYLYF